MTTLQRRWASTFAISAIAAIAASGLTLTTTQPAFAATAAELYVAPTGSDSSAGTLAQPFRTLERARQAIRDLKSGSGLPAGGVNINLRGGKYPRTSSFTLGAGDSGTASSPITYRAYNGERVELLGGAELIGADFTSVTDTSINNRLDPSVRSAVKQYDLAAHGLTDYGQIVQSGYGIEGTGAAPELFFNNTAQTLARYPNTGFTTIVSVQNPGADPRNSATPPPYTHPLPPVFDNGATFTYSGSEPDTWVNTGDIWMYGYWYWDWADGSLRVENIDAANKRITTDTASVYSVRANQRYYYYNVLEELDAPGEFYVDRTTGKLYLYPPAALTGASISLSTQTQPLMDLNGASYVTISGLTFHTTRGDAVQIQGGTRDQVLGNTFTNLGGVAVRVLSGTEHTVDGNEVSNTGKGGIVLQGGDRATLTPARNRARNNVIHDYSRLSLTYNPGIQLRGVGNEASHNEIYNAPHQAIQFEGNDHVIEYNHIHHVVQQTADSGAIYGMRDWTAGGTAIRYNYIHDLGGVNAPSSDQVGIYLDDLLSGIEVIGNIVSGAYRPALIGGGRNTAIENNIFIGGGRGFDFDNRGEGWASGHCSPGGTLPTLLAQVAYTQSPWVDRFPWLTSVQSDKPCVPKYNSIQRNVFQATTAKIATSVSTYGKVTNNWQTATAAADLGFENYAGGDLRLRSDSPIYTNIPGFQPIPFSHVGPESAPTSAGLEVGLLGWTGTARVSAEQAHSGLTSHKPTADREWLTKTLPASGDGTVSMWFYDDATDASVQAVGNVTAGASAWRAIGVATTHSTSKYVYRVDATFTPTTITRTTGWHRFTWAYGLDDTLTMSIDGTPIAKVANSPGFDTIAMGDWWADNRTGNVYFDDVTLLAPPTATLDLGPDTLWQGVHNISSAQVHSGPSSFAQVGETSWLTRTLAAQRDGTVRMWMYDDAADTSMQWVGNVTSGVAGVWRAVGVNTDTSTTKYAFRVDATWTATTVTRTTGWHELVFTYDSGTTMTMSIDGVTVATVANSDKFGKIELGDTWSNAKSGVVYFDDVSIN